MRAFVTATGTDAGKTFVTAGLVRHAGGQVRALKPVMTGYAAPEECDAAELLRAAGRLPTAQAVAAIAPFRFAAPLSPDMAAAAEGRVLEYEALLAFCRGALATPGPVLIEGVGGAMVPLDGRHTVLDWMAALPLPAVLVAGTYLGAISHALTALAVLRARSVRVACVVVNDAVESGIDPAPSIERHGGVAAIRLARGSRDFAAIAAAIG